MCLIPLAVSAQVLGLPPIDSVRLTVTPPCRPADCPSPETLLVSTRGAVWFRSDSFVASGPADSALIAAYLAGAAAVVTSRLPERIDRDSLLCAGNGTDGTVVTVAFYADTAVRRYDDFHQCAPAAGRGGSQGDALRRLRILEDELESLRPAAGGGHDWRLAPRD